MPKNLLTKISALLILIGLFLIVSYFTPDKSFLTEKETEKDQALLKKIGQMLMIGFQGTEINQNSYISQAIQDLNLGGIILFDYDVPSKSSPRNILNPKQTKKLITDLQSFSKIPLFIAVDAEGGYVNRLKPKYGFIQVPSAQEMGNKNPQETKKISFALAEELAELGINLNFAPVVDVNVNPNNPVIGKIERSFSADPEKVVAHASNFIQGHHQKDIITALKHFPGHGSSETDSHKGMTDITQTYQEKELIPYQELISQEVVDMVMTAHIVNRDIDADYPATLSPLFIDKILRQELNFQGVVVSDDMQMGAITEHYGFAEAIILAIQAGCDMLIISNNNKIYDQTAPYRAQQIIFQAVQDKKIPLQRIEKSYQRIHSLKQKFNITQN